MKGRKEIRKMEGRNKKKDNKSWNGKRYEKAKGNKTERKKHK